MELLSFAVAAVALAAPVSLDPGPYEPTLGRVVAHAPAAATSAELRVAGRAPTRAPVVAGRARFRLAVPPGRYDLSVRFRAHGRVVGRARSEHVWVLPPTAARAAPARTTDARLAAAFAALGGRSPLWSAFWVHDLATGRTAGWNADAAFPAASLVKLGVLVAALDRFGARPRDRRIAAEIRNLARWSSNDASNRLLVRLGGSERAGARIVELTLHRLGATSSTFTGFYRLGTAVGGSAGGDAPRPLPFLPFRRTTARDTGRILATLHAAAFGRRNAMRRARLSRREARLALGYLLDADTRGDNAGLVRPSLPQLPLAQKHGWTTSVRHTAAIVYRPRGPLVVVVLTYRPQLALPDARVLGRRFARLLPL